MDRVIVKAGTKTNMYQLFEDLQNYSEDALKNVLQELVVSGGVQASTMVDGSVLASDTTMKVTGVPGQNYVSVAEGYGLTDNMQYLYVSPGTTVSVSTLGSGVHSLYVAQGTYYSDPVDVMSGFAYAQPGISQQNSRAHHNTVFVWDTDPVSSGLWLADVTINVSGICYSVTDKRYTNVLKLEQALVPDNVVRTDRGEAQAFDAGLVLPSLELNSTSAALLTLVSGVVSEYLSVARLQDLLTRIHTQGTDTGTTATSFRVGNTTTTSGDGYLVMLEPDTPMPPKNLRIVNVGSPTLSQALRSKQADADLAEAVRTGLISHEARVTLEWNYRDIVGDGGKGTNGVTDTGKFRITNSGGSKTWTVDELVGYHLYMPSAGLDYKITANLATVGTETVLTVTPYGHTTIIDGINASNPAAVIHSNCDVYELIATPVLDTGALVPQERIEKRITMQESPTSAMQTIDLPLGQKFIIKVRAKTGTTASVYTEMPAGSYTKTPPFATIQNYAKPYYVQLPTIDSTGAKVGANTTPSGFTLTIVGWDIATDFEICYTTDASGPDFLNETHEKFITRQRSVDIVASGSRTYYIAVRPLISGQAVAVAKTAQAVSGAGGSIPKDNAYPITNINFKTYTGTALGAYDVTREAWAIGTIYSPAGSVKPATFDSSLVGSYITIGGTDYIIADLVGSGYITITDLAGNLISSALSGAYEINTSKAGRMLARTTNWPVDAQITSVIVEQWSKGGNNNSEPVLRWYQESMEAYADSIPLIEKGSTNYSQTTDVTILAQNGNRTLVVDLWDPSLDDNTAGFVGNVTIYWKPYIATGRKTDNTATPPITLTEEA